MVIVLAIIFYFSNVPDIKMEDDYHLDDPGATNVSHSMWTHPHFVMAVVAQFLYVAAQAGIFSFFINYMTSQVPPIPASWSSPSAGPGWFGGLFETHQNGLLGFSNKAASNLTSLGFLCFLIGRFTGSAILKKFSAYTVSIPQPPSFFASSSSSSSAGFRWSASFSPISSCPSCSRRSLLSESSAWANGQKKPPRLSSWRLWAAPSCQK
jgi:fucose permease